MDHGHPLARLYPVGMVWDESNLVVERVNGQIITEANLLKAAIHGVLSKESRNLFDKMVGSLNIEVRPFSDDEDSPPERLLPKGYKEE